jgi:VanZ family protein
LKNRAGRIALGWVLRIRPSVRRWALIGYWILLFGATHWPALDRYKPKEGWPVGDFFMHLGVYTGWSALWYWVLDGHSATKWRHILGVFILGSVFAVFDEWTQALVERSPAFDDLSADMMGVILGLAVAHWIVVRLRRIR